MSLQRSNVFASVVWLDYSLLMCADPALPPFPRLAHRALELNSRRVPPCTPDAMRSTARLSIFAAVLACGLAQAAPAAKNCHSWCLAGSQLLANPATGGCGDVCSACPAGTFKVHAGFGSCKSLREGCDAGQRVVFGGSATSDIRCEPEARLSAARRLAAPSLCRAGQYVVSGTTVSDAICDTCPRGHACSDGTTKTACPTGTYAERSQTVCTACDVTLSEFQDEEGQGRCTTCAPGMYHELLKEVGAYEYTTKAEATAACVFGGFSGLCSTAEVAAVRKSSPSACFAGWASGMALRCVLTS